jgi:hypothetical protein
MRTAATATAQIRLLGIRHHGPGSARAVEAALRTDPPDMVLIECPADAEAVIGLAAHPDIRPPVAMLAYVVDRPERAVFYPFASFSPEWVAMRWALDHGVPVRCIDLPARTMLADRPATAEPAGLLHAAPPRPLDPIAALASAAGYDDAERWWEDVVEYRSPDAEGAVDADTDADADADADADGAAEGAVDADAPFRAIGEAMTELRALYEPLGEPDDRDERWREAHMRASIRRAVADGARSPAVVCGAWHVPALASALVPAQARLDTATLRGLPKAKVALTWVPWTHRRLASGLGYRAGVVAPGWYHHLHTHAGPQVVARWFSEAAQVLRRADYAVSAADVVEATRLAEALAVLRGRPLAGLSEVTDAARAALGQGSDIPLRLLSSEMVVGAQLGAVPDSTPMVPLARSLAAEQKRWRLKPEPVARTLELDLRRPLDLGRSQLLHRMMALDVPWGRPAEGRGSAGTFRESWQVVWEPEFEVRLIEASGLGTTLDAAAAAALAQRATEAASPGELTMLLEQAMLADLDAAVPVLLGLVRDRAAVSDDIARLMEAVPALVRTIRYGDVRRADGAALAEVVAGIVIRVTAGLVAACTALDDDGSAAMADLMRSTQSALALLGDADLLARWRRALDEVAERDRVHGLLQGLAARLLADAGTFDADAVERRVSRALSPGAAPLEAAAFVEGFLGGSGTVLLHDPVLLRVVDRWLAALPGDAFTDALPLLRRTFGAFEPAERRALGQRVRTGEVPAVVDRGGALDPLRVEAALATVALLLGRPQ